MRAAAPLHAPSATLSTDVRASVGVSWRDSASTLGPFLRSMATL